MADRGPVVTVNRDRPRGRIVFGPDRTQGGGASSLSDPPGPFPASPDPRQPSPSDGDRLSNRAADRLLTVNPADGAVPVDFGSEFMPVGGDVIFARRVAGALYVDFSLGEGPIENPDGIKGIHWGDGLKQDQVHALCEIHYGEPGDTGSTLISQAQFDYAAPEGIVRVSVRFTQPDDVDFDPFTFKCFKKGLLLYDVTTTTTGNSSNPALAAYRMLVDPVFSIGKDPAELLVPYFQLAQLGADQFVDPAVDPEEVVKQWEVAIRFDQQDSLESQLQLLLDHCFGRPLWDGGKLGIVLDLARAPAMQEDEATPILFQDHDTDAANGVFDCNTVTEASYQTKARSQKPTVVILEWTDASKKFADATAQYPKPEDVDPAVDWIPLRLRRSGITTQERADRYAEMAWRIAQLDKDILLTVWESGLRLLTNDRFRIDSRILLGAGESNDNVDAVAGQEDVVLTDATLLDLGVQLRASLYRDSVYALPPLDAPDPEPPTDLRLYEIRSIGPSGEVTWTLKLTWKPAITPYYRGTRVTHQINGGGYVEDGEFVENVFYIADPTGGAVYDFQLYTELLEGSESIAATISTTVNAGTIPEVVHTAFSLSSIGYLSFQGPIQPYLGRSGAGIPPPATVSALAGGIVLDGAYQVRYAAVYRPTGETGLSDPQLITIGGGNNRIDIDLMDEPPVSKRQGRHFYAFAVYCTKVDEAQVYFQTMSASNHVTLNSIISDDLGLPPFYIDEPVRAYILEDNYGAPDPRPVIYRIPASDMPFQGAPLYIGNLIHQDPAFPGEGIVDFYIRVVSASGAISDGVNITKDHMVLPPQAVDAIFNQTTNQTLANYNVEQTGELGMSIEKAIGLSVADGSTDNQNIDGNFGTQLIVGPTADFEITGLQVNGADPTRNYRVTMVNNTSFVLNLANEGAGSNAAARLALPRGSDVRVGPGGLVSFRYSVDFSRWFTEGGVASDVYILNQFTTQNDAAFDVGSRGVIALFGSQTGAINVVAGDNDDVAMDPYSLLGIINADTPTTANITGMAAPSVGSPTPNTAHYIIWIHNAALAGDVVFKHDDAGSIVTNRMLLPDGLDVTLGPRHTGCFWYDNVGLNWRLLSRT